MTNKRAFTIGFFTALLSVFLVYAFIIVQFCQYQQRAKISEVIVQHEPLKQEIAHALINRQPVKVRKESHIQVNSDGWIFLITPKYSRYVLMIPQQNADNQIEWQIYFERGEIRR